jgi:hypothetical protein
LFIAEDTLIAYARGSAADDLFALAMRDQRDKAMRDAMAEVTGALKTLGKPEPWSPDIKATDDFLDPVFRAFFQKLGLLLGLRKSDYHELAHLVPKEAIDPEIEEKLDMIVDVAQKATPRID